MVVGGCVAWNIEGGDGEMSNPTMKEWQEASAIVDSVIAKERARCAEICAEVRRTALRQTTGDMAHANGIAVGAEYCERKIRGEK